MAPVALKADDDHHKVRRYYDRDARDYHEWNEHENNAYRRYLQEQHRENREFHRLNRNQQHEYFRWRHSHPDVG